MASLSKLKQKLREIPEDPTQPAGDYDPYNKESNTKYFVISAGDKFPKPEEIEASGDREIIRLLDGRIDSDDRLIGTIAFQSRAKKVDDPDGKKIPGDLDGIDLTEHAADFQKELRRTGLVYNIQTSTPPVEIRRNLSDARGAGRQVPKVAVSAILFQFKVV